MAHQIRILHFEDNPADKRLLQEYLNGSPGDYRVRATSRLSEGLELLAKNSTDVVLLDLNLPDSRGIESVRRVISEAPSIPIIILSGENDEGLAIRAVHEGAQDYLIKGDICERALVRSIHYAIERKGAERRVIHLNRLLRSVREIDRLIVREKEKEKLLKEACGILHTVTGFSMVWIGLLEEGHANVTVTAASGKSTELLKGQTVTWDDSPTGRGPSGTAIRTRKTHVYSDPGDPIFDPWRDLVARAGIKSCIVTPLIVGDRVFGVLNVYSSHQDIFDDEEVMLIEEIGRDLAFALAAIESEQERARVQEALREFQGRYKALFDSTADAIFVTDFSGHFLDVNQAACDQLGYDRDELLRMAITDIDVPEFAVLVPQRMEELRRSGIDSFETAHRAKDGTVIPVELNVRVIDYGITKAILSVARDITERKAAEEALKESEQRYRSLFKQNPDAVYSLDLDGRFLSVNRSVRIVSGYSEEELLAMSFEPLIVEDYREETRHHFMEAAQGRTQRYESCIVAKDGRLVWLDVTNVPIIVDDKIVGVYGIAQDITEKKKTEEALASQNAFMQDLINAIPNPVLYKDAQGRYLGCNAAFERYLGRTRNEIVGRAASDFLPGELGDLYREKDEELLANPGTQVYEARIPNAEGDTRDLVFNKATFLDKTGAVGGLVAVIMDITERKKVEEVIRQSEERFRTFFETSRDVVFLSTLEGKFLDINPAGNELFGYSREEFLTIDVSSLYANPNERERFGQKVVKYGFVENNELRMLKKDGTNVECLVTASVRKDQTGKIVGYQGIIRDITERKRMEQRLIQAEKLSSLGGILSGVAHELNNPLTSIIGNAQLLMRRDVGKEIKEKIEVIMKESVRSAKIIQGLLAFARKRRPERIPIKINDVIMESYRLREYELRVNGVNARLDLSDDIPETLGDPYQLQQVFMNVISNANDALSSVGGGSLIIRSRLDRKSIVIEFVDDGPGIPADIKKYVFDPFFTTKEVGKGTGLGLSIAYGIVSEHDGRIEVESLPGNGTTLIIELPLVRCDVQTVEAIVEETRKVDETRDLLVVEDEQSLRDFIAEALSTQGYRVDTAPGGEQAIELIGKKRYAAVISDLKMPGISGRELYTYVQRHYPDLADRILFVTGDVLGSDTQSFLRITGNRYLEKPFEVSRLLNTVAEVLAN